MMDKTQILILDDESAIREGLEVFLSESGYQTHGCATWQEAKRILDTGSVQVMILDIVLQGLERKADGMDLLRIVKAEHPEVEVIMISGHATVDRVINAWRVGAIMFLEKPYQLDDLLQAVQRAETYTSRWTRIHQLEDSLALAKLEKDLGTSVIAKSPQMKKCLQIADKYALNNHSILVTGESGTGKEIIARLIHYSSPRKDKPFVPINVTAIPHELFESTLFGHVKGAYTGAITTTPGLVDKAADGTLFLDEIGDLPLDLQVKLLRLIESREFYRVGDHKPYRTNARFIFATMYDLNEKVEARQFRNDLYYRISDLEINIPPLRERPQDIKALAVSFLRQIAREEGRFENTRIGQEAMTTLLKYKYPGNVRELRKIIRKAVLSADGETISSGDLFSEEGQTTQRPGGTRRSCPECESYYIRKVLKATGCNASQTMKLLGISRAAFYAKLKKYNIKIKSEVIRSEE
jgi:DNA-binding NtrC family response regulator